MASERDPRGSPLSGDVFVVGGKKGKVNMANMYWVSGYHGPQSFGMSMDDWRKWAATAEIVRRAEDSDAR